MAPRPQQTRESNGKNGSTSPTPEPPSPHRFDITIGTALPTLPQQFHESAERLRSTQAYQEYEADLAHNTRAPLSPRRASADNTAREITAVTGGDDSGLVLVNVGEIPAGLGHWEWLNADVDGVRAREMGFDNPAQVELARSQGLLPVGHGQNAAIFTVWYPDADYSNPRSDDIETPGGRFAFHTTADQAQAALDMGGQAGRGWDLRDVPNPTAEDVQLARQAHFRAGGYEDEDPATNINIVYVPSHPSADRGGNVGDRLGQYDPNSGLLHDPANDGEHDQTGGETAKYHSRLIEMGGKNVKITLDRDRARAPHKQPHKAWIVEKKGQWQKYIGYDEIDWTDMASVEKMNKWKEQALSRCGWSAKRGEVRVRYTASQRKWMEDRARAEETAKVKSTLSAIAADFNAHFRTHRPETGLTALYIRIRDILREKDAKDAKGSKKRRRGEEDEDEQDEQEE